MKLAELKENFKAHPLVHTVSLSAAIHLLAFIFFSTGDSPASPVKEKLIKVKYILKEKTPAEEVIPPVPENKTAQQPVAPKKTKGGIRTNPRPKSAIIQKAKIVPAPHSAKRNPVPILYSKKTFKPVNPVLNKASMPHPVSESRRMTRIDISQAVRPSPRISRKPLRYQSPRASFTNPLMWPTDMIQSLYKPVPPAARLLKYSDLLGKVSLKSAVQAKHFTEVTHENSRHPTSLASTKLDVEGRYPRNAASIQKPVTFTRTLSTDQPPVGAVTVASAGILNYSTPLKLMKPGNLSNPGSVVHIGKKIFRPSPRPGQAVETLAQAPSDLSSEFIARYQPAIPITATHFTSPLSSGVLQKEASIPSGFSDETINRNEAAPEKVANLSDGIGDLPSQLLDQIKNGFSAKVRSRISQVKYYPRIARNRGFEGQPVVAFTLGNGGELLELSIVTPSPFKLLDNAALDAVKSAGPYPPIPKLLKLNSMKIKLPISFTLEER